MRAWLQFFRLPNLPTAPGDALAGASVVLLVQGGSPLQAFAAGAAALFLYMYGLADNDLVGAADDARNAPGRPIPSGAISLRAAKFARSLCLFLALLAGGAFRLPPGWWLCAALLTATVCLYNRRKGLWAMGLCRGLSLLCGAVAVLPADPASWKLPGVAATVLPMALGWTLYIAAVTKLSEGEEAPSGGLGGGRYALGLPALVPLLALLPYAFPAPALPFPERGVAQLVLPALGCLWAFAAWCGAVAPLGAPHGPAERRPAVGRTIGALLYLQLGFILLAPGRAFLVAAAVLWFSARLLRRLAPSISGS